MNINDDTDKENKSDEQNKSEISETDKENKSDEQNKSEISETDKENKSDEQNKSEISETDKSDEQSKILNELIEHIKFQKDLLCKEWVKKIIKLGLFKKRTQEEISFEVSLIYDNMIEVLNTGDITDLQKYAKDLSGRIGIEISEVTEIILLLKDIITRELFKKFGSDSNILNEVFNTYETYINKVLITISTSFVQEREHIILHSTPLVDIWEKIVMLPLIGILDQSRSKQITEEVLERISTSKTEVFVIDISGIASVDAQSIGYLIRAIQAVRLMGSDVIITGIRPDVAVTITSLGIDISNIVTRRNLKEGLEYAFSKLGLFVTRK